MTNEIIRVATEADITAIITLIADDELGAKREKSPDDPVYREAFAEMMAQTGNRIYVIENAADGKIIGCGQMIIMRGLGHAGARRAEIKAVRVDKSLRGRGLGSKLIRHLVEIAREADCKLVQLTSNRSRKDAHRFYENLGFARSHEGFKLSL